MATTRVRAAHEGFQSMVRELLVRRKYRVWVVPLEEGYSAVVTDSGTVCEHRQYVKEELIQGSVEDGRIIKSEHPSYTPLVVIPDREGDRYENYRKAPLMRYQGYRLLWADSRNHQLDLTKLGADLRKFRQLQGWSLKTTGMSFGIAESSVRQIECGLTNPSPRTVRLVLDGMGVDDHDQYKLFSEEEEEVSHGI